MRLLVRTAAVACVIMGAPAFAQSGKSDLTGTWLTEDGRAKIRVEHCGEGNERICGFVVWMKDPLNDKGQPRTDVKNPDPAKRSRPSLGLQLMTNLKAADETHFEGEIYNADNGKMYNVTLAATSASELEVRGCMMHFLCGSQTWARVPDIAIPSNPKVVSSTGAKPAAKPVPAAGHAPQHDTAPGQIQQ